MTGLLKGLIKAIDRALDPVCQNPRTVMFGEYRGHYVRLVPVLGRGGHIDRWIPSPDEADRTDQRIAQASAAAQPVAHTATPPAQPGFNPAEVAGL